MWLRILMILMVNQLDDFSENNTTICCYSAEILKPDTDINHPISDLETNVAETEDHISVLDSDVTELDVLVSTLQEENAQLQQTVNLLLQRVAALEVTDAITNATLDGNILYFNCYYNISALEKNVCIFIQGLVFLTLIIYFLHTYF